jgi:hypothetical protein
MKKIIWIIVPIFISCQKEINTSNQKASANTTARNTGFNGHLKQTNTYSSEVALKWMNMQLRLMAATTGVPNNAFCRPFAYSGVALYEAVVPGMPAYQSIATQLSGLTGLPETGPGLAYHWAASANAALALMNRKMFPNASTTNKGAIDSLENALNIGFGDEADQAVLSRSVEFGRAVAQKVFDWAETDGYLHANDAYSPPVGAGLWVPTPPASAAASTPYWGNIRSIIPGSGDNAQPAAPIPYSENPASDFYKMVKQVYDASLSLTPAQTAQALYWRDLPGVTTPGHYLSILKQVLDIEQPTLDKAAIAYALDAITVNDAAISCWKTKYTYNLVRPVTYIRTVMGHTTWSPLLTTPAHPEYSSAHAVLSAANADVLTLLFGENYNFTDHTYDYLGFAPRSYGSFRAIGEDAGNSRLYAGIHYQRSIDTGLEQGRKVAANIVSKLQFLKE